MFSDPPLGDPSGLSADTTGFARTAVPAGNYCVCSFLLLGQNYVAEHVEVRLPAGIALEAAIAMVSAARALSDAARLPCVREVHPQPQRSHAICVTLPGWPVPGAAVAIDSRDINGMLFSVHFDWTNR